MELRLGISSYTFTWSIGVPNYKLPSSPLTTIDLLHKAAENGISVVQIADNLPLHSLNQTQLSDIKDEADELGIQLEIGTRGTDPDHLLRYLEIAKFFESKLIRTLVTIPDIEAAQKHILQVLPYFNQENVYIAIENHGLHTTQQLTDLFDSIDSEFVGCCLDTVNSLGILEPPDQVIDKLVPYVLNLHIKDFDIVRIDHQMGFEVLGTPAGCGKLNIVDLLDTVYSKDNELNTILELWTPFTRSVEETVKLESEWFNKSLTYLKSLEFFRNR